MELTQENIALWLGVFAVVLLFVICTALHRAGAAKERDRARTLETLLLPKETVKAVCPSRGGRWILTSKRLIIESRGSYAAIPFRKIKRVSGKNGEGKITSVPAKMVSLTVTAQKEFPLSGSDDAFRDFARQLRDKTAKKPKKKHN